MKAANPELFAQIKPLLKTLLLMLVMMLSIWQVLEWMKKPSTMPIKTVRVEGGLKYLSQQELSKALETLVEVGYFTVDNGAIVNKLTDLEWVKRAGIRRVWPDTLVVSVVEQTPVAIWNETQMLNDKGNVFKPSGDIASIDLPYLFGRDTESKIVLSVKENLDTKINDLGLHVQQLTFAEHGSWSVVLNNGLKIKAGNESPEKKVNKSLRVLASLQSELIDNAKVMDLRYPNGVAVTWKEGYVLGQSSDKKQSLAVKKEQPQKG